MADDTNAFVDAAACGDIANIRALLSDPSTPSCVVNKLDKDGRSAFHYSCLNDDVLLCTLLLDDARVQVDLLSPKSDTCLHFAALYACLEVLKLLLSRKDTKKLMDRGNQWGETPLHLCAGSGDKGAAKAAGVLLGFHASLLVKDKWQRGPMDVARDNGENALVGVFEEYLATRPEELRKMVLGQSEEYSRIKNVKVDVPQETKQMQAKMLLGAIGTSKLKGLKKVEVCEKTMFAKSEGKVGAGNGFVASGITSGKVLSKLIDFPGDREEIVKHLANKEIDPAGADAYGLTALHKFASWNKTEFIDLLLPHLTNDQVNSRDPDGKTALHWAVEMASVAAISRLIQCPDVRQDVQDAKGRTPMGILEAAQPGSIITRLKHALLNEPTT